MRFFRSAKQPVFCQSAVLGIKYCIRSIKPLWGCGAYLINGRLVREGGGGAYFKSYNTVFMLKIVFVQTNEKKHYVNKEQPTVLCI